MLIARRRLRDFLQGHGAASALAGKLGVTPNAVWTWKHGKCRPDFEMRQRLEEKTNGAVRADDWLTAREKSARAA